MEQAQTGERDCRRSLGQVNFDLSKLKYGCSVTDACIDWQTTENIICEAAEQIRKFIK